LSVKELGKNALSLPLRPGKHWGAGISENRVNSTDGFTERAVEEGDTLSRVIPSYTWNFSVRKMVRVGKGKIRHDRGRGLQHS